MTFDRGYLLWLLVLIPLFVYLSIRSYGSSRKWLHLFARIQKTWTPFALHTLLLTLSLTLVVVSLAGPKVQYQKTVFNRSGIELALGIDVSKSMLAEDVSFPSAGGYLFTIFNRLNRARYFALNFLSELHGERIGVFVFARKAVEVVPFTRDYGYCRYVLRHIAETDITIPGSDLGDAIRSGISMVENTSTGGLETIVLISDGEDISTDKSSLYEAVDLAARKRIRIYTVGIGSGKGVLIPIRSARERTISSYYIDEDGSYLKTALVEETLQYIATDTGGRYFRLTEDTTEEALIQTIIKDAETIGATRDVELAWFNLAPLFLIFALLFFVPGMLD